MKVMCINDAGWCGYHDDGRVVHNAPGPTYGEISTVESIYSKNGETFYNLVEYPYPDDPEHGFDSTLFIHIEEQEREFESTEQIKNPMICV